MPLINEDFVDGAQLHDTSMNALIESASTNALEKAEQETEPETGIS